MNDMLKDIEKVLLSEDQIENICKDLGSKISEDYKSKNPLFIGFLKGCAPFFSELLKRITIFCEIDFLVASSYNGTVSTEHVLIKKDIEQDIKGRDIILVEDIVDTGNTLKQVVSVLEKRNPNSIRVVTLLDKPTNRKVDFKADYVGAEIPNEFIIGYGLDYNEKYRNLPFIGVLKKEVYNK